MKICPKCHSVYDDDSKFCTYCGEKLPGQAGLNEDGQKASVPEELPETPKEESRQEEPRTFAGERRPYTEERRAFSEEHRTYTEGGSAGPADGKVVYTDIVPRSIPMAIILSIVTCGIYGLYWFYKLNNEVNEMAEDTQAPEGLLAIVFVLITCGIYQLYWFYQMGRKCDYISGRDSSNSILFLVLGIFGLGIVSYALIQDTINKALS